MSAGGTTEDEWRATPCRGLRIGAGAVIGLAQLMVVLDFTVSCCSAAGWPTCWAGRSRSWPAWLASRESRLSAVSGAVFCLVYGFSNAATHGWHAPSTYGLIAAGVVLLAIFAAWQGQAAHPLLPPRVVLDRNWTSQGRPR